MTIKELHIIIFGFLITFSNSFAQSQKEKLEIERNKKLKKVEGIHQTLLAHHHQQNASLEYLSTINEEIEQRKRLLDNLHQIQPLLKEEVEQISQDIQQKERHLKELKKEYGELMYVASKTHYGWGHLALIFSSQDFHQLIQRMSYLHHYQKERKREVLEIEHAKALLDERKKSLDDKHQEQEKLLILEQEQITSLLELEQKHQQLLVQLKKEIPLLEKQLQKEQKALKNLENQILKWISFTPTFSEENISSKEKTKITNDNNKNLENKAITTNEEIKIVEDSKSLVLRFSDTKGKMPYPVKEGFICTHFGRQAHPVLPKVFVENLGVDIRTNEQSDVYAVFEGTVLSVNEVPELNWMVIVSHGDYFSVYAKLEKVKVKKGQKVTSQMPLGTVVKGESGFYDLQFQIWKGQEKLNPEEWLEK
ncbi:MAG: peptidoglycan DD-metalloendopeptidase family protein [Flammeovirgaceae bacterium]